MVGILDLLTGILGEQQPLTPQERFARMRLGGEDTPAGGGVLDAVGRRIMEQGPRIQAQAGQPQGILSMQEAPQQPAQAPQSAMQPPQVSMPQQGGGGLLGALFGRRGPSNQTVQYLINKGYDPSAAQAIASDPDTLRRVVATVGGPQTQKEDPAARRIELAKMYGLSPEEERAYALTGQLPTERGGEAELGLNIVYGVDDKGNDVAFQPSKAGGLIPVKLPEGFKLAPGVQKVDLGTAWGFADRNGNIVRTEPKDLAGAAAATEAGKAQGAAAFDLPRVEQNAQQTLEVLERMKTHPGREGSTGFWQGMLPSHTPDQVDFQSLVDQTQGQSFLQAFQMLKGGGQITEVEGQKATNAISRLGNQRLSDAEYLQAITDLEEVVKNGLARARRQAGSPEPDPGRFGFSSDAPAGARQTKSGVKWSVEP